MAWTSTPKPKKLKDYEKASLKRTVQEFVQKSEKLSKIVNRVDIRAGRIYLYHLVEQFDWDNPDVKFIVPLIDGKYIEYPYARISVLTNGNYTLDWQRHNGQWISFFENKLEECLKFINEDQGYFN